MSSHLASLDQAECTTMVTSVENGTTHPKMYQSPYLARALRSAGFGIAVGLCVAILRRQSITYTLIYSVSIALSCWFCIDVGRRAIAGFFWNRSPTTGYWPGWRWMLVVVVIGSSLGFIGGNTLADLLTGQRTHLPLLNGDLREGLGDLLWVILPAIVITYFFYSRGVIADREAAAQAAQRQVAETRLRLLEAQLEPHMFFNTLANLHVLIGLDPPRAQAMLDQLISFLRATLSGSRATEHPLRAEFSRTRDYLALMQVRMENRLRVHFELPEALADIPVPPLLLQPLVENSIKHGLEPSVTGGLIDVRAAREGASLVLSVRDTGVGLTEQGGKGHGRDGEASDGLGRRAQGSDASFGLRQIRERLATQYGAAASLTLDSARDADGGTLAVVRLPIAGA